MILYDVVVISEALVRVRVRANGEDEAGTSAALIAMDHLRKHGQATVPPISYGDPDVHLVEETEAGT